MMPGCPHCGGRRAPSGTQARCVRCTRMLGLQRFRIEPELVARLDVAVQDAATDAPTVMEVR